MTAIRPTLTKEQTILRDRLWNGLNDDPRLAEIASPILFEVAEKVAATNGLEVSDAFVVVYVEGGVVQSITTNVPGIKCIVRDQDNIEDGEPEPEMPDNVEDFEAIY